MMDLRERLQVILAYCPAATLAGALELVDYEDALARDQEIIRRSRPTIKRPPIADSIAQHRRSELDRG